MRIPAVMVLAFMVASCGGSRQSQRGGETPDLGAELGRYEGDFHPSDYDSLASGPGSQPDIHRRGDTNENADTSHETTPELVQGFRVQIFASTRIDEANAKKAEAEGLFPGEWFYLEYDPPTYKIRAGNFLHRYDAERFARLLTEKGYPDSWIVPERVYKEPPPPSPQH